MRSKKPGQTGVVDELRRHSLLRVIILLGLFPGLVLWSGPVAANPRGGSVVHGDVRIGDGAGGNLRITQNSANAIINWDDFSIDAGEMTRFVQPGRNAAVLNRVTGGNPSAIHGALRANGNVFVVNPNGILVGAGGTIDVHGLVLSTLDVDNGEFLAGGDMLMKGASDAGVTNLGRVNAIGGDVFLIGRTVHNSGTISAAEGTVGLAAGQEVLLTANENAAGERVFVRATGSGVSGTGIFNDGTIEGAAVELKSHGNIYALAINNKGSIRATGVESRGGRVFLDAPGGSVSNTGTIRAAGTNPARAAQVLINAAYAKVDGQIRASNQDGSGGAIRISAADRASVGATLDAGGHDAAGGSVIVEAAAVELGATSIVDVSGTTGGEALIGGGFQGRDESVMNSATMTVAEGSLILADGSGEGNAGTVVVWADESTEFRGTIRSEATGSGDGGFVEVSGKESLLFDGTVSTLSAGGGRTGTLLLDPTNFTITPGAGASTFNSIGSTTLTGLLGGNNVILATDSAGAEEGDITVSTGADVIWNSANALTLLAHDDIFVNASIQNAGTGGVHLVAGWNGTANAPGSPGATTAAAVVTAADFATAEYGNSNGTVFIGSAAQTTAVRVGSRGGETTAAGHGLSVLGSTTTAGAASQLGYFANGAGPVSGDIELYLKGGGLTVTGGTTDAYAQVGHGGAGATNGAALSGAIAVNFSAPGAVNVTGGSGQRGYGQVGHGGRGYTTTNITGDISLLNSSGVSILGGGNGDAYAQVGHGGRSAVAGTVNDGNADFIGAINVTTVGGGDLLVRGTQQSGLGLADGRFAYGQLGHGGTGARGDASGALTLGIAGRALVQGGAIIDAVNSRGQNYGQIGHGGYDGDGAHSGAITLATTGDIEIRAGVNREGYAQIGHGGTNDNVGNNTGNLTLTTTAGSLRLIGGNSPSGGESAYSMLGHGGINANGSHSGDITVTSANEVTLLEGLRDVAFKLIGHGGRNADGNHSGSISVTAQNNIRLVGGNNDVTFAQIGHGGDASDGVMTSDLIEVISNNGRIDVIAGFAGGTGSDGRQGYAQIGLGGNLRNGNLSAPITVSAAGPVTVQGGGRDHNFALIGNGGDRSTGTKSGAISVTTTSGDISVLAGRHEHTMAMIGHGGFRATGAADGDVFVQTLNGNVIIRSGGGSDLLSDDNLATSNDGGSHSYAQVGHGGDEVGVFDRSGAITVRATGSVSLEADRETGNRAHVQIGHGGNLSGGNVSGDIEVTATGGNVSAVAGVGTTDRRYVQIGHGGIEAPGNFTGAIDVNAGGNVILTGGGGENNFARLGHGGVQVPGEILGNIAVDAGGAFTMTAGTGANALAQLGHGGIFAAGSVSGVSDGLVTGTIDLTTGGNLSVLGGAGNQAFSLLGHGGLFSRGFYDGAINANIGGAVAVTGGGSAGDGIGGINNFAQVGHSLQGASAGLGNFVEIDGRVVVEAEYFSSDANNVYRVVPTLSDPTPGLYANYRGDAYLLLPDGAGTSSPANPFRAVTYEVTITTPGTYLFYPRWTGYDGGSDSIFFDIVELKDGAGGTIADHYEFAAGAVSNFNSPGWHGSAGFELNAAGVPGGSPPAEWTFTTPGTYTIRSSPREDGIALDALVLQQVGLDAPTGMGPAPTFEARSGTAGSVTLNAAGNVVLSGGVNSGSHAAVGHGGSYLNNLAGRVNYGSALAGADVTVRSSGGNVSLSGGAGAGDSGLPTGRYAAIGHHGAESDFDAFGNVTVEGGSVSITGGSNSGSGAQIGHGGDGVSRHNLNDTEGPMTLSGSVRVDARNALALNAGTTIAGSVLGGSARIGHGGAFENVITATLDGELCVVTGEGVVLNAATGDAVGGYTRIGHGGINIEGVKSGDLAVTSGITGTGGVLLTGGAVSGAYAQIGHGGLASGGDMSGNVSVVADNGGAIALNGGSGAENYAMVGHGDGGGTTTSGTRQGGVRIFADNGLSATDGGVANTNVFHQTNGGLAAVDYLGGNGFQLLANGTTSFSDGALNGVNTMVNGNFASGPVGFAFSNNIDISVGAGMDQNVTTTGGFVMMTGGSLEMLSSYQNSGTGSVTLVAGWDGSGAFAGGDVTFNGGDFCDPSIAGPNAGTDFNNCDTFGNNDATLVIGNAAQTGAVRVGSRAGANTFAGHGLVLNASAATADASGQLGFFGNGSGTLTGAIDIYLKGGGLDLNAGTTGAFAQIGHGGTGSTAASANAAISISFCEPGAVNLNSGDGIGAYTQIGHGGVALGASRAGDIYIGGNNAGDFAGAISLNAGSAAESYSHIGHGGRGANGSTRGDIRLESAGLVSVNGGTNLDAYAQVGHGGHENRANHGVAGDEIVVIGGGGITLAAGDTNSNGGTGTTYGAYAQIGNGGYDADGNLTGDIYLNYNPDTDTVAGGGDIILDGGNGVLGTNAQVGHGGRNVVGTKTGDITLGNAGDLAVRGGIGTNNYAQIGHGGNDSNTADANGNTSGSISVVNSDSITLQGGSTDSYVQIGHGGLQNAGNHGLASDTFSLNSTGNILLSAGTGAHSYAFVGNGGRIAPGTHTAAITINAADLDLVGGAGTDQWTMIGLGGLTGTFNTVGSVEINASGDITLQGGGTRSFAHIGSGGRLTTAGTYEADLSVNALGTLSLLGGAGTESFAMIGDGGAGSATTLTSSLVDISAGNLVLTGGTGTSSYAQIGHGGAMAGAVGASGAANGANITVEVTGFIDLNATANSAYAQIGHGGFGALSYTATDSDISFNTLAGSGTGLITLDGGTGTNTYAQIGHGGSRNNGDRRLGNNASNGDIVIGASGGIALQAGSNSDNFARIGHGGEGGAGDFSGDIVANTSGDLILRGGSGNDANAQIGHGGTNSLGANYGDIRLSADGVVDLDGGTVQWSYAQIGHGGYLTNGAQGLVTDEIVVTSASGGVNLQAGSASRAYAMIGNGGHTSIGDLSGSVYVNVDPLTGDPSGGGDIVLTGGATSDGFVQIGHGGKASVGTKIGDISVATTTGGITVAGAAGGSDSYAQVGHGGVSATGNGSGNVSLRALGVDADVSLLGGGGSQSMVMIGHGGTIATGVHGAVDETISIEATRDVLLTGGTVNNALVHVGNGGLATGGGTKAADIAVTAGRDIILTAGQAGGDDVYVQIGNGGAQAASSNTSGDITILAGGLVQLRAGTNPTPGDPGADTPNYAQIGHGGHEKTGNHGVAGDKLTLRADALELIGGSGTQSYAQVGNGGYDAGGNFAGDICINVTTGVILDANTQSGENAYVQIGHGGTLAGGGASTFSGDLTVTAGSGGVTLRGGDSALTGQYAQIGHGGISTNGAMSGDIFVVADDGGDLTMTGGAGPRAYVMVGHGDGVGVAGAPDSGTSSGTRQGGIQYFVDGDSNIANGAGGNAYLHHRTNTGGGLNLTTPTYLGGNGYQYVVNGTSTAPTSAFEGLDTMINGNIGTGHVVVTNVSGLDYTYDGPDLNFDHDFDFIVMVSGNINMLASYQNAGRGRAILVAGWDGSVGSPATINLDDLCDPLIQPGTIDFNDCDSFGNNDKVVNLGSATQTNRVSFGSRQGLTAIAGYGLNVFASATTANAATQVGYFGTAAGDISGVIDIRLKAGGLTLDGGTAGAFAQIGHGGRNSVSANITDEADIFISFCEPGDIQLLGGTGTDSYAQIGNGGVRTGTNTRNGDITVTNFRDLTMDSGTGSNAYTQIGNGGYATGGVINGNISLTGTGAVTMASRGTNAYSHIGHGGRLAVSGQNITGNVELVTAGDISLDSNSGGDAYVQIGLGGYITGGGSGTYTGDISVRSTGGNISLDADNGGTSSGAYVQIGSGGLVKGGGTMSGTTTVAAAGTVSLQGGNSGTNRYAQIGFGGAGADGDKLNADVNVTAGSVEMTAGNGSASYAQIGIGGSISNGNNVASGNINGDITVTTTAGGITMRGGTAVGQRSFVQIGSGGSGLTGGTTNLGAAFSITGDTTVTTVGGGLTLDANNTYYAQIGHGGKSLTAASMNGAVSLDLDGDLTLSGGAGTGTYAMVGHGGRNGAGAKSGEISATASGDISLLGGGGGEASAQIGHSGRNSSGTKSGGILVDAGGAITLTGGDGTDAQAQIGHGGRETTGDGTGAITVISGGALSLTAGQGAGAQSAAQIGHGGIVSPGNHSGDIGLDIGGGITMLGGGTQNAIAQIGHGGRLSAGDLAGAISIAAVDAIVATGGSGERGGVMVGHGGSEANSAVGHTGDISVLSSSGAVRFTAGTGIDSQARIGHGGANAAGDHNGDIAVSGAAGIVLTAGGGGTRNLAQIGHGGGALTADLGGDIFLNLDPLTLAPIGGGAIRVNGGTGAGGAYAQVGHGGLGSGGSYTGEIRGYGGSLALNGGSADQAYALLGHGGISATGTKTGNISLETVGAMALNGSATGSRSFAQIGHGGILSNGNVTGDISLTGGGSLSLQGGANAATYALVGHGGFATSGQLTGNIAATIGGGIDVLGGGVAGDGFDGGDNFAQIGHSLLGAEAGFGMFTTIDGRVVIEAHQYDTADRWVIVPDESPGTPTMFINARGDIYVQIPDGQGGSSPAVTSRAITYQFEITQAGTYEFFPRWTGWDGGSDSIFADIVQLKDGAGGTVADFYEFTGGGNSDFSSPDWFVDGGFETNSGGVPGSAPVASWDFAAPGVYTLRINAREDGAALDAFVFQLAGGAAPSGMGPAATYTDSSGVTGTVDVTAAGDIRVVGGLDRDSHAAIGHGGSNLANGSVSFGTAGNSADLSVRSTGGNILVEAAQTAGENAAAVNRYAVIGHHGAGSDFDAYGDIDVAAAGRVDLRSGLGEAAFARIGYTGTGDGDSIYEGNVTVTAGDDIALVGGENNVQIGHGGTEKTAVISGAVTVDAGGVLSLDAGDFARAYAQVGHGGLLAAGTKTGEVSVTAAGGATLAGGGGADTFAMIGHGGNRSSGAVIGDVSLETGGDLELLGGGGAGSGARVGHGGISAAGNLAGALDVTTTTGSIILEAGSGNTSAVAIGHGGSSFTGSVIDEAITVSSAGGVSLTGGTGVLASARIGHGGMSANGLELSGAVEVAAVGDIVIEGGTGGLASSQIGHLGTAAGGVMDGNIRVNSGSDIVIEAPGGSDLAYAKIGHGDDFSGPFAAVLGTNGTMSGDIEVGAARDITLVDGMIGHVNASSPGTAGPGVTQIGVSRDDPTDPNGGTLTADADSEFSGSDELRFYLPRRGNNQIAAGALLNGEVYTGARPDPSPVQGEDEYTINIIGDVMLTPNEHGNVFGTGPAPATAAGYAFYYDTIVMGDLVLPPGGGPDDGGPGLDPDTETPIDPDDDFLRFILDDRTLDDWQRDREKVYSGFGRYGIYYENFDHYGFFGESTFHLFFANGLD